ncbi:uncharacterized protein N7487_000618 [Penicillium crustosum]|uniref:uncharacterized protein n=1 Tax=Penicillium crustosum TaxID=36656 RepID=UPI002382E0CB|nr:uncharacterized protein N7487_000618 [Penicillium crustosum]KAJ5417068.1 hypothetical protein N7487_000618 [Penicillium crustosum]
MSYSGAIETVSIKTSEADPSRPDNLANWSRTRYQLRHSPIWLTRLDQITLRTGVARATNCATAPNV